MLVLATVFAGVGVSTLPACGGEVNGPPTASPLSSSHGAKEDPEKESTTDPVSPETIAESPDFLPVPCLEGTEETTTDVSAVAAELGYDELSYVYGWKSRNADKTVEFGRFASTKNACVDEACGEYVSSVISAALTSAMDYEAESAKPEEQRVWAVGHLGGPEVRVLVGRRGATFSSVTTTKDLRALMGPLDSPWKAHLFVL
ncbi:MAG TPA: hypothetical protein VM925_26415, partial [Labilithrix sp.]|nr:hypothetical protein [Labilithrix sp.]